jgi:hypothetical protein
MTLSLAIAIIAVVDIALIAGLAYVMSRARLLTPHVAVGASATASAPVAQPAARSSAPRGRRLSHPLPVAS